MAEAGRKVTKLPAPETMLTYASILEKPQYYIHNRQKFLLPRGEIITAAIAALRHCASLSVPSDQRGGENG